MRKEQKTLTYFSNNGKELWNYLKSKNWNVYEEFSDGAIFLHEGLYIIIDASDEEDPYVAVTAKLYAEASLEVCRKENSISHLFWTPRTENGLEWNSVDRFVLIDDIVPAICPENEYV